MASKPADDEHPFGHGRMEYIAAFIVAFPGDPGGIFPVSNQYRQAAQSGEDIAFDLLPFLILVLSIGIKLWMASYNRRLGKRIDSKVMKATAADSLGDVITTSATAASILISHFAGVNVDGIAGTFGIRTGYVVGRFHFPRYPGTSGWEKR